MVDGMQDARLKAQLATKLDAIKKDAKPIVQLRHKRVAHRDRATALGTATLPGITPNDIDAVLKSMGEFLNVVEVLR